MQQDLEWAIIKEGITKAKKLMEGHPETKFTAEEYIKYHQCVYEISCRPNHERQLYQIFKGSLEESITSTILSSLVDKHDAPLLSELVLMWSNYKLMAKWLCKFFKYLDRHFIYRMTFPSLNETAVDCFCNLVFKDLYCQFRTAAISLINQERAGVQIDRDLLKNVLLIFVVVGGRVSYYEDFEKAMLEETAAYYSHLAGQWLLCDSFSSYIQKVCWCLHQEKGRASHYLPGSTEVKLLKVVRCQLVDQNVNQLTEKQEAENCGLVTNYEEILSKCAGMTLDEGSSAPTPVDSLSTLMTRLTNM